MCIDSQMLSAYLDGELPEPYRTQVEEHLEHCAENPVIRVPGGAVNAEQGQDILPAR